MQKSEYEWPSSTPWSTKKELEWLVAIESGNLRAREIELAMCKGNAWRFLTHWIQTEDSQNKDAPFQLFPNKVHLWVLTQFWLKHNHLIVPKSRQVSATWCYAALYLWESLFFPSKLTFFQSKKEEDAEANLTRVHTMWERLPAWMKEWQPLKRTHTVLQFPRSRSIIRAIPQGAEHLRGYSATGLFIDEAAFQDDLDKTLAAARPALGKIGKLTIISSAQPGVFADLTFNKVE
jgi:hypothetical protein